MPHDESNGTCEEPEKTPEGKGRGELKPPRVLEALSALGLRALRYAREIEGIRQVVALDNDKEAVEACSRRNIKFNGSVASEKIDLDPYGSPSLQKWNIKFGSSISYQP